MNFVGKVRTEINEFGNRQRFYDRYAAIQCKISRIPQVEEAFHFD